MPKARKYFHSDSIKVIDVPQVRKKIGKELGVPKLSKNVQQALLDSKHKNRKNAKAGPSRTGPSSITALASSVPAQDISLPLEPSDNFISADPLDAALTIRDSSVRAFARELKKVIDRSDVVIQVLDARDPQGTRSRWVEDEVRKREADGKRLIGIVNKIDLVPRSNLEAWLKHLRLSFPVLPFKSSTQSQRSNLSQAHIPTLSSTSSTDAPIPSTAASLGAPALLRLLKQYALSRPHQTLTVGIIGYPNVGKSSLINSLKRSRACAVAAQPGKTRIIQEVVLDKGVKVLDCPGVVLEDFGAHQEDEEQRRRRLGEVMLRNCIKVEEIEDPIAPVEAILARVDMGVMQGLYPGIQPYRNVTEFLVQVALTTGRLKGQGIPNLEAAAVVVLRHWNDGKIPFYTPAPRTATTTVNTGSTEAASEAAGGMQVDNSANSGDAILSGFTEAFDLDGLLAKFGGSGEFDEEEDADLVKNIEPRGEEGSMPVDAESLDGIAAPISTTHTVPQSAVPKTYPALDIPDRQTNQLSRLFTQAELDMLPTAHPLDRKNLKKAAKKSAKAAREAEIREREADADMFDASAMFGSMSVAAPKRPEKKKAKAKALQGKTVRGTLPPVTVDAETQKELDFANFLNSVGAEDEDLEL
ncbi:nuclear GTP-binding protein nug1 [Naganishia albida]|nr:nuclear GTP-binding protein nug1 [Naganishia albida]